MIFDIARKNWQYDLHDYLKYGKIKAKRQAIREEVFNVQSMDELKNLIYKLDAVR